MAIVRIGSWKDDLRALKQITFFVIAVHKTGRSHPFKKEFYKSFIALIFQDHMFCSVVSEPISRI